MKSRQQAPRRPRVRSYPVHCIAPDGTETEVVIIAPSKRAAVEAAHRRQTRPAITGD